MFWRVLVVAVVLALIVAIWRCLFRRAEEDANSQPGSIYPTDRFDDGRWG